jgi:hypothetical protein
MNLYRAEARRRHSGKVSVWRGKWRKDPKRVIQQAIRWREREPQALIEIVSINGMRGTLEQMEQAQSARKPQ